MNRAEETLDVLSLPRATSDAQAFHSGLSGGLPRRCDRYYACDFVREIKTGKEPENFWIMLNEAHLLDHFTLIAGGLKEYKYT
jgi:hypothetical protein